MIRKNDVKGIIVGTLGHRYSIGADWLPVGYRSRANMDIPARDLFNVMALSQTYIFKINHVEAIGVCSMQKSCFFGCLSLRRNHIHIIVWIQ